MSDQPFAYSRWPDSALCIDGKVVDVSRPLPEAERIKSAVTARERKAAAKALRDYADEREAEARSFPLGAAFHGGPLDDAPMFDVQMREVRSLRARADLAEKGER